MAQIIFTQNTQKRRKTGVRQFQFNKFRELQPLAAASANSGFTFRISEKGIQRFCAFCVKHIEQITPAEINRG